MKQEVEALQQLTELLKIEKKEDFELYKALVQSLPLPERKAQGYAWYPINVVKTGYALGDRAYIILERTTLADAAAPHQFRSGTQVNLFTLQPHINRPEQPGIIHSLDKNRMKIILHSEDLPEWLNGGQLGVDLLFDERTYLEMERALSKVLHAERDRLAELRAIFYGTKLPQFDEIKHHIVVPSLNHAQNHAVNTILAARDVAVVHGPPGTGKTTMLVQAIRLLCEREGTVLVTAASNTAVDLLTEKLAAIDVNVVRIGNISRIDDNIVKHTLDYILAHHPDTKNIKKVRIQATEARRQANRYRRNFGYEERNEREHLRQQAKELAAWANQLEDRLVEQILSTAQVIASTLVSTSNKILDKMKFRTVVVDEAAQALEPATWIPIIKASKIVLVGDPYQLPPTVKSLAAQRGGLNITLVEKCIQKMSNICFLNIQYRMNQSIMNFSNHHFYQGALQAHESVQQHQLEIEQGKPVTFIDTAGCGFEEKVNGEKQSRYNPDEFHILREHLYALVESLADRPIPSMAIISPYREQVVYIQKALEDDTYLANLPLTINTIDGFQGQERDLVYITLVRSNEKNEIGFLNDYRRMNVAMTRARKKLVVIGDSATIGTNAFYASFLDYCDQKGAYQSAWEFMQ